MARTTPVISKWRDVLGGQLLTYGNAITTLVDGPETFAAMYRALQTAQNNESHFIYLLGWSCDSTLGLLGGLDGSRDSNTSLSRIFKSVPKVQIRAMFWNQIMGDERKMNRASVAMINDLPNGAAILDARLPSPFNSHHQKVLIVNGGQGVIAFCGGVDLHPNRVDASPLEAVGHSRPNGSPQHDVHCQVQGPACGDLLDVFNQRWRSHPLTPGMDAKKGDLIWSKTAQVYPRGTALVRGVRTFNCVLEDRPWDLQADPGASPSPSNPPPNSTPNLSLLRKQACRKNRSVAETLLGAIAKTEHQIYCEDQYMVSIAVANALNAALNRGVNIIFVIPSSFISDLPGKWHRRKAFINAVLAKNPKDPEGKKRGKFGVYFLVDPKTGKIGKWCYVHAKTWMFDDEVAIIGSANCNRRGISSDSEANLCILDSPFKSSTDSIAKALRKRLWAKHLGTNDVDDFSNWDKHWKDKTSWAREYDPDAGKDGYDPGDDVVDPDLDSLPLCASNCCTSRKL
ncbi:hypothetical protein HT746_01170 [Burkholderia pyrrocinia]|uniref:phospholipase D-like domain-containing protein n=1 Tax=Burkholderia pyrrocinia TaxID=60550 RepID=UPI0015752567|nr:phospholipase D-like domain-containing protein [Burkholderia pyrrocinia]NTX25772.1 hypothetical protein [Burkholderia pyrrocinia]